MIENLEDELKTLIISKLGLEDLTKEEIDSKTPLFSEDGLGLDSVDALELALIIQENFGIKINNETENLNQIFYNINSLANFIAKNQKG